MPDDKPVDGLAGLGEWIWKLRVPVGAVWKLLPWNRGRPPTATLAISYIDDDFRVVAQTSGGTRIGARVTLVEGNLFLENITHL